VVLCKWLHCDLLPFPQVSEPGPFGPSCYTSYMNDIILKEDLELNSPSYFITKLHASQIHVQNKRKNINRANIKFATIYTDMRYNNYFRVCVQQFWMIKRKNISRASDQHKCISDPVFSDCCTVDSFTVFGVCIDESLGLPKCLLLSKKPFQIVKCRMKSQGTAVNGTSKDTIHVSWHPH